MEAQPETQAPEALAPGAVAILTAAEGLMGRHGIEGVSMRQITMAAKMANNSAIAYHFGDRDGLLRAISRWRAPVIAAERQHLLDQAVAAGKADCPRRIAQIITRPLLTIRNADGSHPHAAFVCQMLRSPLGREIRHAINGQAGVVGSLVSKLHSHVPAVPRDLFEFRLRTASLTFYGAVVERDQMAELDPARLKVEDETFLAELDDMLLAIALRAG